MNASPCGHPQVLVSASDLYGLLRISLGRVRPFIGSALISLMVAIGVAQAQSLSCGPSRAGSTCGGSGVASLGNVSGTPQGAGNPIHLVTGNKFLTEVDLPALPGPLGLELVRHYNSVHAGLASAPTALGRGWRLSYDTQLAVIGSSVQILQADGSRLVFQRDASDPSRCGSLDPLQGALHARRAGDGERFDWIWTDGRVLSFDDKGYLIQVALPTGEHLSLQRDGRGRLLRVTDPQGRELRLVYAFDAHGETRLVAAQTPIGRIEFRHEASGTEGVHASPGLTVDPRLASLLTSVSRPHSGTDQSQRRYHYEDSRFPTLLTGISASGGDGGAGSIERRVATYGYDAAGRARLTAWGPADGGPERLLLDHDTPGRTTVTDAQGRVTVAHHGMVGGEWRVLQLLGAGCAACGPAPMSFAYDALGRLVRETAMRPDGRPIRSRLTLRDERGRVVAVAVAEHMGSDSDRVIWIEQHRYEGNAPKPAVSWVPSVIEGRSFELRVERNAAGQVTRRVEAGFSPLDPTGRPLRSGLDGRVDARDGLQATRIEREIRFSYRDVNGRSVLHSIDGPLPNGPSNSPVDSDITRLEWDGSGSRVIRVEAPGREAVRLEHDAIEPFLRRSVAPIESMGLPAGSGARKPPRDAWTLEAQSAVGAPRIRQLVDDFGRVVARLSVDHGDTTFTYDSADRLVGMRDALGREALYERDLRGRLVRQQLPGLDGQPQITQWHWQGDRLHRVDHPVQREHFRYDDQGRPSERLMTVAPEILSGRSSPLPTGQGSVALLTRWRYDEAGRLVATSLPDGSWLRWRRDRAGQVVALERERLATRWLQGLLPTQVLATDIRRDLVDVSSIQFGNGLTGQWVRSAHGELARVLHAPTRPAAAAVSLPSRDARTSALPPSLRSTWPVLDIGAVRAQTQTQTLLPAKDPMGAPEPVEAAAPGWLFQPAVAQALVDDRLGFDPRGNLVVREERGLGIHRLRHHRYDAHGRLLASWRETRGGAPESDYSPSFHAYDADGNRLRSRAPAAGGAARERAVEMQAGTHRMHRSDGQVVEHDPLGRPRNLDHLAFEWDATGRAVSIRRNVGDPSDARSPVLVRFGYNHRGERILRQSAEGPVHIQFHDERRRVADLDADGHIARQWVWLADLPLAVIDAEPKAHRQVLESSSAAALLLRDLRYLLAHARGGADRITWLHANHLGAPVVATDEDGRPRWQAEYTDFGRASIRSLDGFELDLRLPGQYEDPETGLHHNDHRLYHPDLGRYLTPDPLGAPDGPNPYVYVRNNPLRYVDPSGLVLWAFDGTSNAPDSRTNVWHMAQTYADHSAFDLAHAITGMSHYVNGPGTVRNADGTYGSDWRDAAMAGSMNRTLAEQMTSLQSYVQRNWVWSGHREAGFGQPGRPVRIVLDVTGFSRGAALAREFSNRVSDFERSAEFRHLYGDCLDIIQRMLALFDTVLGHNLAALGTHALRMSIPPEVEWVFHAVAMNEMRGLFPLESIHRSPGDLTQPNLHRVERGFIGAHSDVGGGYAGIGAGMTGGDLSDLALMWMVRMAERDAQVRFSELASHLQQVSRPIVHDPRREVTWTVLGDRFGSSREVRFRSPAPAGPPVEVPVSPDPESRSVAAPSVRERVITVDQRRVVWPRDMSQALATRGLVERPDRDGFDADSHELDQRALCEYVQWLRDQYDATIPIQAGCR